MTRRSIGIIVLGVALAFGARATAVPSVTWSLIPISQAAIQSDPTLANMQTVRFVLTYSEGDFAFAGMRLWLPAGQTFYRHSFGDGLRPNPALQTLFPALEFTTYVSTPADTGFNNATMVLGGYPEQESLSFGHAGAKIPGTFSVSWGDIISSPPGTYEIARLTFPLGAWLGVDPTNRFGEAHLTNPDQTVFIWIPEPVASAWVALLFPLVGRRR